MTDMDDSPSAPGSANKRQNDDFEPSSQRRAKRNRYISIACNECKRRKIKCNGQSPCQRCGNLSLECVYAPNCCNSFKDSDDYQQITSHISELQHQVQSLFANLSSLKAQIDSQPGPLEVSSPGTLRRSTSVSTPSGHHGAKYPRFHGPTSAVFNLGVAKSSLTRNFGITGMEDNSEEARLINEISPTGTPPPVHTIPSRTVEPRDVLWTINKQEALRLVNIWRDMVHVMYPVVDIDKTIKYVEQLYSFIDSGRRTGLIVGDLPHPDAISDDETNTLRLILANAVELETNGSSEFGLELFRSVAAVIESYMMRSPDMKALEHLVLASLFYFHRDDEALAWRLNGAAGRMCFELGLHQQETYESTFFSSNPERYRATVSFWSIYVLDRRWSFGTGLPFVIEEQDIDPNLLKPSSPYLSNMVTLTAMSSKTWPRVANSRNNVAPDIGKLEYLDLQVVRWQQSLPEGLNYTRAEQENADRANSRLRVLLYLRANQTRIIIGREVLLSTTAIMENIDYANCVVGVAKDTIQVLSDLNQTTETYRKQQGLYNYFLVSALAALFLAVAHAPAQYSSSCRDEFYLALDLVRCLSANSFVGKRLWKTIRVLKEVGPKIGLTVRNPAVDTADAHSTAAVAMAGLAGHPMDNLTVYSQQQQQQQPPTDPALQSWDNWNGMADDLTSLFEAVGNMPSYVQGQSTDRSVNGDGREMPSLFSNQDGLSRAFRGLF